MTPLLLALAAYLLGSVPTAYLVGRLRGIDLRRHGSGNLGATNTFRVLGARWAVPVLVVDVAKGALPTALFPRLDGTPDWRWALIYGAAAILGHVFPVYLRFRGGKGVATAAGVFAALAPGAVLAALVIWLLVVVGTGYVSLASLAAAVGLVGALVLLGTRPEVLGLGIGAALFVVWSHRANIRRLLRGEEHRFGRRASARS